MWCEGVLYVVRGVLTAVNMPTCPLSGLPCWPDHQSGGDFKGKEGKRLQTGREKREKDKFRGKKSPERGRKREKKSLQHCYMCLQWWLSVETINESSMSGHLLSHRESHLLQPDTACFQQNWFFKKQLWISFWKKEDQWVITVWALHLLSESLAPAGSMGGCPTNIQYTSKNSFYKSQQYGFGFVPQLQLYEG